MVRIARVLTRPNLGGPTRQVVALWHAHRAMGARTLVVVGRCERDEVACDLAAAGIPPLDLGAVGPGAEGFVVLSDLRRRMSVWRDARAAFALRRVLRAAAPDVVHTHTSKAGALGRWAAPRGAVVAHTFHGLVLRDYASGPASWLARAAERRLARRSDLLFAVSASCGAELAELGVATDVVVVPPAVRTDSFAAADRAACRRRLGDGARPAIGYVGRLVAIKRPEIYLALAAALPQVDAYVLGDGPLRAALERSAGPNVHFLGAREDAAELVPGLDLLVLPSRREGFPVVAVEAAAAGARTVGFEVPGLIDLAAYRGCARLVAEADGIDGLVGAVRELIALGPPRVHADGRRALLDATAPQAVASALLTAYRAAMERRT